VNFCLVCGVDAPCARHPDGLSCRSVAKYGGVNRDVVHAMKYRHQHKIAFMMGQIMARATPRPDVDFLVPVPLHKGSGREYNQAELIARGASRLWGIPIKDCLRWRLRVQSQARASDPGQRFIPEGAMRGVGELEGARILLVDDVCTTGNTLLAARAALEAVGADVGGAMTWSKSSFKVADFGW
jgi:predicted amidophosphoribosyltransferase